MIRNHQQKMTKLNSNFKCILFDLDMTIIDSSKLLYLRKKEDGIWFISNSIKQQSLMD